MKNVINDLAQMSQNKTTGGDGHNMVNFTNICVVVPKNIATINLDLWRENSNTDLKKMYLQW